MKGWKYDGYRHSLAAKGISTTKKSYSGKRLSMYTPTYVVGDLPLIGADAIGTIGAEAVAIAPLAVTAGVAYWGVKKIQKDYAKAKKEAKKK